MAGHSYKANPLSKYNHKKIFWDSSKTTAIKCMLLFILCDIHWEENMSLLYEWVNYLPVSLVINHGQLSFWQLLFTVLSGTQLWKECPQVQASTTQAVLSWGFEGDNAFYKLSECSGSLLHPLSHSFILCLWAPFMSSASTINNWSQ